MEDEGYFITSYKDEEANETYRHTHKKSKIIKDKQK